MKHLIFKTVILFVFLGCSTSKKTYSLQDMSHEEYAEQIGKWKYIEFDDSLKVQLVAYFPSNLRCSRGEIYNLAIVKYNKSTLRVIDMCPGFQGHLPGDSLLFVPQTIPPDRQLYLLYINDSLNHGVYSHPKTKATSFGKLYRVN